MSQRDDFVSAQLAKVGSAYSTGPSRCTGQNGYFDCSGLQVYAGNRVGLGYPCTSSFAFAIQCHQTARPQWMTDLFGPLPGLQITASQAAATKGAWAWHGRNEGQGPSFRPNGADGHIKCSLGDGHSVEAFDHAEGVIIGTFLDPECSYFALPPGLSGFDQSSSGAPGGVTVGMTAAKRIPNGKQQSDGRYPFIGMVLNADGTTNMVGFNGGRLNLPGATVTGISKTVPAGYDVLPFGKLNAPATFGDNDNGNGVVFFASDGGSFACPNPYVKAY